MRRRLSLVIGGALLLAAPAAWSATASFNVEASCAANCVGAGFEPDELIQGTIVLSTNGFAPSGSVARADVVSFGILIGEGTTGIFHGDSPAWNFSAAWGADTKTLQDVAFIASGANGLRTAGLLFSTSPGGSALSQSGICSDVLCSDPSFQGTPATLSAVTFSPRDVAPIPLPATAPLAAAGVLALAAMARLARRSRRPA